MITDQYRTVYANSVPASVRLLRGQYFTPDPVCDLMLALSQAASASRILDPCCGTGAFLLRAQDLLAHPQDPPAPKTPHHLYGIELDPQAANFSQLQLTSLPPQIQVENPAPVILNDNFLTAFSPDVPPFDLIIGNPPYLRQEHLHQQLGLQKHTIVETLQQDFSSYLAAYPAQIKLFQKQADLYVWFFLKATQLLKPGGKLAFITSNSWLNTTVGSALQTFLHHHFHILAMVETRAEAWFADAAIQPIMIILEKKVFFSPTSSPEETPHTVALLRLQKPLSDLLPNPKHSQPYWQQLQATCRDILQQLPPPPWVGQLRYIPQTALAPSQDFPHLNWALHLRAPQSLQECLTQSSSHWLPLKQLATVRYPLKTGINAFFYLSPKRIEEFGIEPEFCVPVLKSTLSLHRYIVTPEDAEVSLFSCPLDLDTLRRQQKYGALRYIEWGSLQTAPARQKRQQLVPWPQVPSVQGRKAWYQLAPLPSPHLLACRFFDQRFVFPLCEGQILEDQTFYGITLHQEDPPWKKLIAALLNSTLSYYLVELYGRSSLGDGVLQYATTDMAHFPLPDPQHLSPTQQQQIIEAFEAMASRPLLPLTAEVRQADRLALDDAILTALGCRHEREAWIEALLRQVAERRQLPKLRRHSQKQGDG